MPDSEILLVEDQPREMAATKGLLEDQGYRVTTASSKEAAVELFHRRASRIAAAVIDLRLRRAAGDLSGADVAAEIKRIAPRMPTVSLSAHKMEPPHFDFYFEKGSAKPERNIEANLDKIAEAISGFELSQRAVVSRRLDELRLKYQINDVDFQELIGIRSIPDILEQALLKVHDSKDPDFEGEPTQGARRIHIIEPESVEVVGLGIRSAIPAVISSEDGCVSVELYASPLVYAYGDDLRSALKNFVENLSGYHEELDNEDGYDVSADLLKFKLYLETVFGHGG